MSPPSRISTIEQKLLAVWYGGQQPNPIESLALNTLESLYRGLRFLTRQTKKSSQSKVKTSPPLLVVGNLIAGGAGKTPIVMAVCLAMLSRRKKVGIVSRGYGRSHSHAILSDPHKPLPKASLVGDEPLLLCAQTHCPVAVSANRNLALDMLLQSYPDLDLLVSDDGLQHHRLKRQIEWVVFDSRGQGNGRLLPAGPLRESLDRLQSVDAVIASNVDVSDLSKMLNMQISENWHSVNVVLEGFRHLQTGKFIDCEQAMRVWENQSIVAFSGIANPDKMFSALHECGIKVTKTLGLPDHFQYPDDFCLHLDQSVLITSGKDAVKLNASNPKVWVAEIAAKLPDTLIKSLEDNIGSTID